MRAPRKSQVVFLHRKIRDAAKLSSAAASRKAAEKPHDQAGKAVHTRSRRPRSRLFGCFGCRRGTKPRPVTTLGIRAAPHGPTSDPTASSDRPTESPARAKSCSYIGKFKTLRSSARAQLPQERPRSRKSRRGRPCTRVHVAPDRGCLVVLVVDEGPKAQGQAGVVVGRRTPTPLIRDPSLASA
jgi:hypothetical protein